MQAQQTQAQQDQRRAPVRHPAGLGFDLQRDPAVIPVAIRVKPKDHFGIRQKADQRGELGIVKLYDRGRPRRVREGVDLSQGDPTAKALLAGMSASDTPGGLSKPR